MTVSGVVASPEGPARYTMGDFAASERVDLGPLTEPLSLDRGRGQAWHNLVKSDFSSSAVDSLFAESRAIFCKACRLR